MTFEEVSQYYKSLIGRPVCIICTWNPINIDNKMGGYLGEYPDNVWSDHIKEKHPFLLEKDRKKILVTAPGQWKYVEDNEVEGIKKEIENWGKEEMNKD